MRKILVSRMSMLALTSLPSLAAAQDAPPATPPAATPPVAAAPEAPPPPTPSAAAPTPAAAAEAAPAAPAAEATPAALDAEAEKPIPSYIRLDHDYMFGLQLWAGATYPLTKSIGLATDIYIAENYVGASEAGAVQSWWGEFDIGPALTLGPVTLTPMAGIAFDWAAKRAVALNAPQLYTVLNLDKFYFESWIWTVLYSPFKEPVWNDYFHTRNWALFKASSVIALGPQFEFTYLLNSQVAPKGTSSMPLGGHVELAYGTGNSLGLFLGYELDKGARESVSGKGAVGRLSFVHNF